MKTVIQIVVAVGFFSVLGGAVWSLKGAGSFSEGSSLAFVVYCGVAMYHAVSDIVQACRNATRRPTSDEEVGE